MREWLLNADYIWYCRVVFEVCCNRNTVDWDMFLGFGCNNYFVAGRFVCSDVEGSCFDGPNPVCEKAVEKSVQSYCDQGVGFCGLETESVVPVETSSADREGCVADC